MDITVVKIRCGFLTKPFTIRDFFGELTLKAFTICMRVKTMNVVLNSLATEPFSPICQPFLVRFRK